MSCVEVADVVAQFIKAYCSPVLACHCNIMKTNEGAASLSPPAGFELPEGAFLVHSHVS